MLNVAPSTAGLSQPQPPVAGALHFFFRAKFLDFFPNGECVHGPHLHFRLSFCHSTGTFFSSS